MSTDLVERPKEPVWCSVAGVPFNKPHLDYWQARAHKAEASLAAERRRVEELEKANKALVTPHYLSDWTEDMGDVLWWRYPVEEPPWVGSPFDDDFEGNWHTWWTPLPDPTQVVAGFEAVIASNRERIESERSALAVKQEGG